MPGWTTYTKRTTPSTSYTERGSVSTPYTSRGSVSTSYTERGPVSTSYSTRGSVSTTYRRSEAGAIGFIRRSDGFIETLEGNLDMLMVTRTPTTLMLNLNADAYLNGSPVGIGLHRRPDGFMEFIDI